MLLAGGSDRMVIKSDGKVGIGTTIPSTPLHISDDDHAILRLQNEGTGNTEGPTVELYGNTGRMGLLGFDNSDDIRIKNETSAGKLFFFTNNTVRATVLADGKVGIGTDAPGATLHTNSGTADTVAVFESSDTGAYIGMKDDTSGSNLHVAVAAIGNDLALRSGNSNTVRIKGDTQRVGIGTIDPQRVLEVADNVPAIRLTDDNNAGVYHEILGDGASLSIEADDNDQAASSSINFKVDGSQKATITSDGRLGIGTSSPSLPLHVATGGADHGILVQSTDSVARINMQDNSTTDAYAVGVGATGDALSLFAGSAERVTVASDGDVGIGTTSPSTKLDVNGTGQFSGRLLVKADGNDILRLRDTGSTTTGGYISFEQSAGSRLGYVGYPNNDDLYIKNEMTSGIVLFATNNTTRMVIQADGDVGIGTTSPTKRFHVNAGTTNATAVFESTDSAAYIGVKDNSTSGDNYVSVGAVGDEMRLRAGNTNHVTIETGGTFKLNTDNIYTAASSKTLLAASPPTGTGNDAEWAAPLGIYILQRNSSLAAEKENVTADLGTHLTADMIDQVIPKMWNRIHAPGYPEIGPIAEEMDAISPFLAANGTTAEGEQFLTGINKTAYLSLLVLAVKDLRQRVVELESA